MIETFLSARLAAVGIDRTELRLRLERDGLPVSRQRLHRWLNGEAVPDPSALPALCEALSLTASDAIRLYHASGVPLPAVLVAGREMGV